jgi:putative oxidoreductase
MTQIATVAPARPARSVDVPAIRDATRFLIPVGRALLAAIFVMSGFTHFSSATAGYAAAQGVPLARLAVPLSGILALLGGLSVLLGYRARVGAGLLLLFLVPVTLAMHRFWAAPDAMAAQLHMVMFMKNLGLMGGALMVAHFGAGPYSLDARRETRSAAQPE